MLNIIHYFPFSTSQHITLAEAESIRSEIVWHQFFAVPALYVVLGPTSL